MSEGTKSLYIDMDHNGTVNVDDFLVAIGKTKSNSVYHVAEVKTKRKKKRTWVNRHYVKVYKSDLPTALSRDSDQQLIPITWHAR